MQRLHTSKLFLLILLVLLMVAPAAAVFAEEGEADHSAETDGHAEGGDTDSEGHGDDGHSAETTSLSLSDSANVGTGVVLGLLFLILALVAVVAVVGAVGLGVIGIGYTQIFGGDD